MNHIHDNRILFLINIVVYMCVYYACTFPSSHVFVLIDLCFECFYASCFMFWNYYILLLFAVTRLLFDGVAMLLRRPRTCARFGGGSVDDERQRHVSSFIGVHSTHIYCIYGLSLSSTLYDDF